MTELLTSAQMRAIEQAAIESGEVTGLGLMERAGRGVVEAVLEEWPELAATSHRAVVLCGPGNNGGDGFVVARLLKEWGWEVEVFLYGDAEKLPPDAKANYKRWVQMGACHPLVEGALYAHLDTASPTCLWLDALFGTGLSRPATDPALMHAFWCIQEIVTTHLHPGIRVVAIDMPSGLCADSGRYILDAQIKDGNDRLGFAHMTVTFHTEKPGHHLADGPLGCGALKVASIGVARFHGASASRIRLLGESLAYGAEKWPHQHKYSHGHALILSGGSGATGAARLAARGALRIGAGLVTLGVPPAAQMEVAGQVTAVMLARIADAQALTEVLADVRINALCLGPGMGVDRAAGLLPAALENTLPGLRAGTSGGEIPGQARDRGCVIDADALTALAQDRALFAALHERCVLTPHGGEFARLFPDIAKKLNATPTKGPAYSKVDATRDAAKRAGCTVLFKGPDTVIAAPDGRCAINSAQYGRAAPWLATAGAGDVLAGFIAGLLARGLAPMQAAETAAWLHVECARNFGPGLIAEDLPEELPGIFRALGL